MAQSTYRSTHEWVISDQKLLSQMQNAKNGQTFKSDRFNIAGLPCTIEVCPNGWKSWIKGYFMVYTTIKPLPSTWKRAIIRVKIEVPEFDTQSTIVELFGKVKSIPWRTGTLLFKDFTESNINEVTLKISIAVLKVINNRNITLYLNSCNNYSDFTTITTTFNAQRLSGSYRCRFFETYTAGSMWLLRVHPNGETIDVEDTGKFMICMQLLRLPFNICKMEVSVTCHCKQTHTRRTMICIYGADTWSYHLALDKLSFSTLKSFDELTITTDIHILHVYDENNTEMVPPYNPIVEEQKDSNDDQLRNDIKTLNASYNEIRHSLSILRDLSQNNQSIIDAIQEKFITASERLDFITTRMQQTNDELLDKQNHETININHEIIQIKQQVDTLYRMQNKGNQDEKEDSDTLRVKKWLCDTVKLPQYYDILIEHGFEDLESIADVTMDNLKEMGIDKIGHQNKLIKYATKLSLHS